METSLTPPDFDKENYMASGKESDSKNLFPGPIIQQEVHTHDAIFTCENRVKLKVSALSKHVVQLRYVPDGHIGDEFSYAAMPENFDNPPELSSAEDTHLIRLRTGELSVVINKTNLRTRVETSAGTVVSDDEIGFHWEPNKRFGGNIVKLTRKIQPREHFYGLGDKSCGADMRGKRFELWGSDTYAYGEDTDPLYKNIPFFIGVHKGQAYGVFFDNTHRTFFDFGKERKDVSSFWAQGGHLNYYFIHGPRVADVIRRFAMLTGTAELPPRWALGYHQCKWSYKTEEEYRALAQGFLKHRIPCDALYLDIDYMDGFRCFTWNKEAFPQPKKMIEEIHEQGFKTVAMIDPGIKVDDEYDVYQQGIEGDHFCRQMDGDVYTGKVWPGAVHFPDFTKPSVREWWTTLYQDMVENDGIHGFWNDMNEPADFNPKKTFPRHIRHDFDGHPCSHRRAHNIYGTQMVRATRDGIMKYNKGKRPFVITRSAYAGAWRYASAWTGDNISSWEHLSIANVQCQRLNLSGYSFVGSDIGGFLEQTNGELYTRWIQLGIFHPFCRTHSSGEHGDQEPWSFGEPYTSVVRKFIELRYRLLSYIYTTFWQHSQTGAPMLRPLVYLDDADPETLGRNDEFGMGDHLLVCPITEKGADGRWLYLPRGNWYHYWTDSLHTGGEEVYCDAPLDSSPLYVRAGAVIPLDPVKQSSWETSSEPQGWHLYAPTEINQPVISHIYSDGGDGYDYQEGQYHLANLTVERTDEKTITLRCAEEGQLPRQRAKLHLHGLDSEPYSISIDGKEVASPCMQNDLPETFQEVVIKLS